MDRKKSVERALSAYSVKQIKSLKPKRKNKAPEKEVECACLNWMRAMMWDVQILSAKAVYNQKAGRYLSQTMSPGTPDCVGVMPNGTFVAVEFKSPGNLHTFNRPRNYRQKEYIKEKISHNSFAVVVDSIKSLQLIFETWQKIQDPNQKRAYLFSQLP